jgi:hypothetical protein
VITNVYHVPSLNANLFSVPQLTHTSKKVELWPNQFVVKDMHNAFVVFSKGFLNPKDKIYKLCDFPKKDPGPTTLIAQDDDRSRIQHERLRHLNF